jgi:hypothetical protein
MSRSLVLVPSLMILSLAGSTISAADFIPFTNTTAPGLAALAEAVLGTNSRLTIVPGSVVYVGTSVGTSSTSFARRFDLGTQGDAFYELSQDGVLFTNGNAVPPQTNTSTGFGAAQPVSISDAVLTALVGQPTKDVTALDFDFTVEAGVNSLGFEFMFMSEEYPEYVGQFVDGAAVYVDGVNYAYYLNDPTKYLSVNQDSLVGGGLFFNNMTNLLPIEYDGVTRPSGILAPLDLTRTTHHLRIVIADTKDQILDSAILVADIFGSETVIGAGQAGIVPLASPRMTNYNVNTFEGGAAITIPVRLSQPAIEPVTVTYEIAGGSVVLGTDYSTSLVTATGTISYAVGEYVKNVTITPLTDGVIDGDKTLTFRLTAATKAIPLRGKTVSINIFDADMPPNPTTGGSTSSNPTGDELVDGKEQGNNRCGAGTGLALIVAGGMLVTLRRRRG